MTIYAATSPRPNINEFRRLLFNSLPDPVTYTSMNPSIAIRQGENPERRPREYANGMSQFIGGEFSCGCSPARDCSIAALRLSSVISSLGILKVPSTTTAGTSRNAYAFHRSHPSTVSTSIHSIVRAPS